MDYSTPKKSSSVIYLSNSEIIAIWTDPKYVIVCTHTSQNNERKSEENLNEIVRLTVGTKKMQQYLEVKKLNKSTIGFFKMNISKNK